MTIEGGLEVRPYGESDYQALQGLYRESSLSNRRYRAQLLARPDLLQLAAEDLRPDTVIVAISGEMIVGFAVVLPKAADMAELDGLFVAPSHFGKGIGRVLADRAAQLARSRGARRLRVVGNPDALGFYLTVGFTLVGQEETLFDTAPVLERALN